MTEIGRQYELYNGGKLSSNIERDRQDLRKNVPECERFIRDRYKKINSLTQEIADCNQKIDELPKRINRMLAFGKERRIERKEIEQEAECLRSKADSFCLQGLLDREVNGFKSTKHDWNLQNTNGFKSTKHDDLLIEAKKSACNKMNREKYATACEKSAIGYEASAKEAENKLNEFRRKKGELQTKKDKLERSLPKWEEKVVKKKENQARKEEKMRAEMDYKLWRIFQ